MPDETRTGSRGAAEAKEWAAAMAKRVGLAIAHYRKKRNLSAVQLAERTSELGYPITRGAIAKIEGGHRGGKFDIPELLILSAALQVPPALLLFSDMPDGQVLALPNIEIDSFGAAQWLVGEELIDRPAPVAGTFKMRQMTDEERLMVAVRKRQAAAGSISVQDLEAHGSDSPVLREWIDKLEQDRAAANAEIVQLGGKVHGA